MPYKSVKATMHEFKSGGLHSGKGGPVVKKRKQAVAIALSMKRRHQRRRNASVEGIRKMAK